MEYTTSVKEIMSSRVITVQLDDKLSAVKNIFDSCKIHHLLVVDDIELLGIISDRDLFKALSPKIGTSTESQKDAATLNKRVHQIMTRHPIVLHEDATIDDAIGLFNTNIISCIPIVNSANRPIGIVSWRDILKYLGAIGRVNLIQGN
ncbi:arabinose 5-phosphate isomerase KpsF [mine drainage metagenome]|uniref:Arabinose 5-phosphate isomerase KpsF n=1 Tax=mine drainage metagenome TaxID=410659 RepID=A0A1J5PQM6_9ZZZZ